MPRLGPVGLWALLLLLLLAGPALPGAAAALQLVGAGSTLAYPVYTAAALAYSFVAANVSVAYAGLGSGAGICRIENATRMCAPNAMGQPLYLDFAGSDALLGSSDYASYPDLQMYPTMAAAVVPIFNLGAMSNLTLSTSLLAQIFRGSVRYWDDASILALNPHLNGTVPARQPITLVVRSDSSGTTQIFKKALAAFDPVFRSQIGTALTNVWTNVTTTQRSGNQGVVAYVMSTAYTLGYSELGIALTNSLSMVKLRKTDGSVVSASITSTDYAVLELGLSFGNNGDDAAHLTADLENAQGVNAWPIVGYTYLVMRKSTLRPGASCANVRATVAFFVWFWTSDVAANIVQTEHFSALPNVVQQAVLGRFEADIACGGAAMYESTALVAVPGQGTDLLAELFATLVNVYSLVDSTVNLTYVSAQYVSDPNLVTAMFAASTDSSLAAPPGGYKLIFAGAGLVVISQVNITLDGATLAGILQGTITTWLHPALKALNPGGILDASGAVITNASKPIQLLRGPLAAGTSLPTLMTAYLPSYTGAALMAAPLSASDAILRYTVLGNPWSLAVTPYTGDFPAGLLLAPYRHADGTVVAPSWQAIRACATNATFDATLSSFKLSASTSSDCYPLALPVHLRVRQSRCDMVTDPARTAAVDFVEWIFSNAALQNALEAAYLAPLMDANVAANVTNQAVLDAISCAAKSTSGSSGLPIYVIVIVMCAGVSLFFLIIPAMVWHSTRRMRALRKQFSNDNVAQECAAAIARFDLDAVGWLNGLKNPNKIQKSFVQIVRLLTEVKPFIPDQLLMQLVRQEEEPAEEEEGSPRGQARQALLSPEGSSVSTRQPHLPISRVGSKSTVSSRVSSVSGEGSPRRRGPPVRSPMHRGPPGRSRPDPTAAAEGDQARWTRKHCALLVAKLLRKDSMDDPANLSELGNIVTALVPIAKKNGATIERVEVDTVIVHWGLSGHVPQAVERATVTGMEMAGQMGFKLGRLRADVRLRISVTYGWCHVTTLSASGHRFFISSGTELKLAKQMVHDHMYDKCQCILLVSPNVYKEVHFSIKCFPRAWFQGMLVWQPAEHVQHEEGDEWMYELQRVESMLEEGEVLHRALVDLFHMVGPATPASAVQQAVQAIKDKFGEALTPEDVASLDHLLQSLDHLLPPPKRLSVVTLEG